MGNPTRTLIYQSKLRCCSHRKHVKERFPDHIQGYFFFRPCRYILPGHIVDENGCVTNKAWEPGTVKDWPQNLISAVKSRTAEFQAQSHFKSLRSWLKIIPCYDSLGICEFMNSSLSFWIPCTFLFIVMALLVFKRLPERLALANACKHSSDWAGWETRVQHSSLQKGEAQVQL